MYCIFFVRFPNEKIVSVSILFELFNYRKKFLWVTFHASEIKGYYSRVDVIEIKDVGIQWP